ncbi:restriction endonuclease subunit S, partial [Bacillus safensis]
MSKIKKTIEELLKAAVVLEEKQRFGIPENWIWTQTGSITDVIGGGTPKSTVKEYFEDGDIPWLTPADLSGYQDMYISRGKRNITEVGLANSSAKILPSNTVLLSSRAPIGYVTIASNDICTNQGFKSFLPSNAYYPEYLYWYLKFSTTYLESMASGTTFKELSGSKCKEIALPLPPLNEQKRIADKVEHLLSKIEEAKQLIEEAKETFELRQAAILDRAFRGELTRKWRIDNPNAINVNQILEEVKSKIVNKKLKHSNVEEENLYELPNGWAWVRLGEVSNVKSSKRIFASEYADSGIPFYRSKEIGELSSLGKAKSELFISEERYAEIKEKFGVPKVGDLLLTSVGTIGNTWMCDGREFYYKDGNITQIERNEYINTEFVQLFFNSYLFKKQVNLTVSGSAYNALTIEKINQLVLPFPPLEEQQEIVRITKKILKTEEESKNLLSFRENLKG